MKIITFFPLDYAENSLTIFMDRGALQGMVTLAILSRQEGAMSLTIDELWHSSCY
jgi:hypothetical protein